MLRAFAALRHTLLFRQVSYRSHRLCRLAIDAFIFFVAAMLSMIAPRIIHHVFVSSLYYATLSRHVVFAAAIAFDEFFL